MRAAARLRRHERALGLFTDEMPGKPANGPGALAATDVTDGFVVDAWLANWDVVGLGYDNPGQRGGIFD